MASVPKVAIYSGAGNLAPVRFLQNPTVEHIPLVFLARARQGEWLYVQIPMRPNESMGWIRESDVDVSEVHTRILVESAAHHLTVFQDDVPVFNATVAVGTGTYYLPATLEFTPADSGSASGPITYMAYPSERPVLSGGRRITGWSVGPGGRCLRRTPNWRGRPRGCTPCWRRSSCGWPNWRS